MLLVHSKTDASGLKLDMNDKLYTLSQQLGDLLLRRGWQVSTAESCTGGWIARCITDIPGSSNWFASGFITYSNAAKHQLLQVPLANFDGPQAPGAVSAETVTAMAKGALAASGAQLAVASSGIAGPGGGSTDKPVGTVWLAWAWSLGPGNSDSIAQLYFFEGGRDDVRQQSVEAALNGLIKLLESQ